jgi:hypothetical protein
MKRILTFLVGLIDPNDPNTDDGKRTMGLRLIRAVLETAGYHIGMHTTLVRVIQVRL